MGLASNKWEITMNMFELLDAIGEESLIRCERDDRFPTAQAGRCGYVGALKTFRSDLSLVLQCPQCASVANLYNTLHSRCVSLQGREAKRVNRDHVIYLSGPYTAPDPARNVHDACLAANELEARGWLVIIPHTSHLRHLITPKPYEYWLKLDLALVGLCGVWTRFAPGRHSEGSDIERTEAERLGLTLYASHVNVPMVTS